MISVVVFAGFFIIFALLSLIGVKIPPAEMILSWLNISLADPWSAYTVAILNGFIYGLVFWLIYSIGNLFMKKERVVRAPALRPVEEPAIKPPEPVEKPIVRAKALSALDQGIEQIKGMEPSYAEKLKEVNITTVRDLLEAGATRKGRRSLAKITGVSERTVLTWVNRADLFRVKGIGTEYSELLNVAGVKTVVQLSRRNPANLRMKLEEINREKMLVKQLPSVETITEWIRHAKSLKRRVEY